MSTSGLAGRHTLQIPGPTNVPDRVQRAMVRAMIDHRGPECQALALSVLSRIKAVFKTAGHVVIYPSSGTGAWEAALTNTLSPGDRVLMHETGQFAMLWIAMAKALGLDVQVMESDWRRAMDPVEVEAALRADTGHQIKAVCVVHNETANGVMARLAEIRAAMDRAAHPALLIVDTISSLGSVDYRHDEWRIDVTVAGSQKGLMLPPGLSFNAISAKALEASLSAKLPRSYFDWKPMLANNAQGFFPYTPATGLLFGLSEAIDMLMEEGLDQVFARHTRLADATRAAARAWGLEIACAVPSEHSNTVTAVMLPVGHDPDAMRKAMLERFDISLGTGLGRLQGRVFRIGHLGWMNDLALMGALSGVEMGLKMAGVPLAGSGVLAAMEVLSKAAAPARFAAAAE